MRSRKGVWTVWILGLVLIGAQPAAAEMSDVLDAVCRVSASDGGVGTGCVFEIGADAVFVLTNRHVVGRGKTVKCNFWRNGHQSAEIQGTVRAVSQNVDAAVVLIPKTAFGGVLPAVIPFAPQGTVLRPGDTVSSAGCAKGAWATGWKGHVLGFEGTDMRFTPPPAGGRSGSAICDQDGNYIVGLLWGRSDSEGCGYAVSLENLYRAFQFSRTATGSWKHTPKPPHVVDVQCGPGGCPMPGQGQGPQQYGQAPNPPNFLLPYRRYDQQQGQNRDQRIGDLERRAGEAWPTLPGQPNRPPPGTPGMGLDQIEAHLQAQDRQLLAIAQAVDARLDDVEKSQGGLVEKLGRVVAGGAGGTVFGWAKTIFSTLGIGGSVVGVILIFFVIRQGRKNAHILASGVDKVTDWIPGQWDDRILDPLAVKVADYVATDNKKAAASTKTAAVKAAKAAAVKAAKEEVLNGTKKK